MSGEIALDTSTAIRFLNGDATIIERVLALPEVNLPMVVVGELLFGAENSTRVPISAGLKHYMCPETGRRQRPHLAPAYQPRRSCPTRKTGSPDGFMTRS